MKKYIIVLCALSLSAGSFAQSEVEAIRYSFTNRPATARSYGMGSTFGALGADMCNFFINPAGLGQYKRGGMEFSLALNTQANAATYNGLQAHNSNTSFTLNNFGLVGSKKPKNKDWTAFNFGVGYTKTNNFNDRISIRGTQTDQTLMDVFSSLAAGNKPDAVTDAHPFTAGLAYQVYAINPLDTNGTTYVPAVSNGDIGQIKNITRSGAQSETSIAFGGNYRDVFSIGGALIFQGVRFNETGNYTEEFEPGKALKNLQFDEKIQADGTGVGLKLGFLAKPTPWLRVGAAFHTPTLISMREVYTSSMASVENNGTAHSYSSPELITTYNLRTPARTFVNMAFVLGKVGVVAADYEYAAYNNMSLTGTGANNDYNYNTENNTIDAIYRGTHRVSAGAEFRIDKSVAIRAGATYQQSPFVNGVAINDSWITYNGGFGYRSDYFFVDLAAGYSTKDTSYYIYQWNNEINPASIKTSRLNTMLSVGFRY